MGNFDQVFELAPERQEDQQDEAYIESSEVGNIADQLISNHLQLARLTEVRLVYLLQVGKKPDAGRSREATIDTIAKAMKVPKLWRSLTSYDALVWVNAIAWDVLGQRQREAVVLHELLHIDVQGDEGKVVILKHDVEEFGLVVATYGAWHGGLDRFGQQLSMFEARPVG